MAHGKARDDDVLLLAHAGKLAEDGAAALGLRAQQYEILVMRAAVLGVAQELLAYHGDGRQRRAEAMCGGGRRGPARPQLLPPRHHSLRPGPRLPRAPP